jgi:diguanylate cyclase (GGDEF)-like protein
VIEALRRAGSRGLRWLEAPLGEHEAGYRKYFLRRDISQALLGLSLLTLPVVFFAWTDYLLFGWSVPFGLLIMLRGGYFACSVLLAFRLRAAPDARAYDRLVIAWALAGTGATLVVNLTRPPTYTYNVGIDALVLLAAYLIVPSQLSARLLIGTGFTLSAALLFWTGRRVADPVSMNVVWATLILANAMGLAVSCRLSKLRRREYLTILELEHIRDSLQIMATVDSLTGVLNRRRLFEVASAAIEEARRIRRPLAIIAIDLDHFKQVNDRLGHAAGDDVLTAFSSVLRQHTRRHDIVGRIGGEEFVIVLPRTSLQEARDVAERIRSALHELQVPVEGGTVSITVSLGVAALRPGDASPEDVLKRADQALYAAKRRGRDRVEAA